MFMNINYYGTITKAYIFLFSNNIGFILSILQQCIYFLCINSTVCLVHGQGFSIVPDIGFGTLYKLYHPHFVLGY